MQEFELFDAARKLHNPSDRQAFLDQACAGNSPLRMKVEALLNAPVTNVGRPETPAAMESTFVGQMSPLSGTLLAGRYKLLENIGEGGMGSVWVAEQETPVKRKVAVKLIKAGMDSQQVLARFEAERQALALMDHPNIAKVFDGGVTEQGHPFFVMEFVKGVPITDYCDRARLSLADRLQLFIPVCQAVQHAHHKGIVHRDLKPSNILVSLYDGLPVPKVIDFGLAKALHHSLTEQTLHTAHGLMLGTPLYMSPEQAESSHLDVDTRTDVYSLGVVLYELLTGSTPLEKQQFQKAAYDEIVRLIKDVEPPKPSSRLSSTANLPSIAAQRNIDPRHLQKSLAGDLDWIVMKSLEKERSRRYETATSLARDIERFLHAEVVEACPPSAAYRLQKFVKRHRGQVIAAALVLLALLLGIVGTSVGMRQAWKAQQDTSQALDDVKTERDQKEDALNEKTIALEAKSQALHDKDVALQAAAAARDEAEQRLIQSILRPIGHAWDDPDDVELASLHEWSQIESPAFKFQVLEAGFENPRTALRIARRTDWVVQAVVGLSPARHTQMAAFLAAKQRDASAVERTRWAACWMAVGLGSHDLPMLGSAIAGLATRSPDNDDFSVAFDFAQFLSERTDPFQRQAIAAACVPLISMISEDKCDWSIAMRFLGSFTNDMLPADAQRTIDLLIERLMHGALRSYERQDLIETLTKLHARLSREQIVTLFTECVRIFKSSHESSSGQSAIRALKTIKTALDEKQVLEAWDTFVDLGPRAQESEQAIVDAIVDFSGHQWVVIDEPRRKALIAFQASVKDPQYRKYLEGVVTSISSARPAEAVPQPSGTFEELMQSLQAATSQSSLFRSYQRLAAQSFTLNADQLERVGDVLLQRLETSQESEMASSNVACLNAWAARLSPSQIDRGRKLVCAALQSRMSARFEMISDGLWNQCLTTLTPQLSEAEMVQCFDPLIDRLHQVLDDQDALDTAERIERLASMIDKARMARTWEALIHTREQIRDDFRETIEDKLLRLATTIDAGEHRDAVQRIATDRIERALTTAGWNPIPDEALELLDPKVFASYFGHAGCLGIARNMMLEQFEGYARCVDRRIAWPPSDQTPADALILTHPRKFHTVHDVAIWIQRHWPDFDFDAQPEY